MPGDRSKRDVLGVVRGLAIIGRAVVLSAFADYLDGVGHDVTVDLALPVTSANQGDLPSLPAYLPPLACVTQDRRAARISNGHS